MFDLNTRSCQKGKYRALLLDGFGSHTTYEFVTYCERNNILLYYLIPHSSHYLQPLDVGVFHLYKHNHAEYVNAASRTGCQKITKTLFLDAIEDIRKATFRKGVIKNGWQLTGLYAYNPSLYLMTSHQFQ
jgi:hypothetical protein